MIISKEKSEAMSCEELLLITYKGKTIHEMNRAELLRFIQFVNAQHISKNAVSIFQSIDETTFHL